MNDFTEFNTFRIAAFMASSVLFAAGTLITFLMWLKYRHSFLVLFTLAQFLALGVLFFLFCAGSFSVPDMWLEGAYIAMLGMAFSAIVFHFFGLLQMARFLKTRSAGQQGQSIPADGTDSQERTDSGYRP